MQTTSQTQAILGLATDAAKSPFYTQEHVEFRNSLRKWVHREITPYATQWDEDGAFPLELYKKAADIGLLQLGFPEEYGGVMGDVFFQIIANEELAQAGAGGISAGLMSHGIAAPPIAAMGSPDLKQRVLPAILAGEKVAALGITEPGGGSDVASLKTTARRDGDHYIVNGSKMFITSGIRADYYTVAVRTGGDGMGGISLLLVEKDTPGFSQTPLQKMGWWQSDTAALYFDEARVPAENLIGQENMGFLGIMQNFNRERIGLASVAVGMARVCIEDSLSYARERETFGKPLIRNQVIRHKLIDMCQRLNATKANLDMLAWRVDAGEQPIAEICMLKNQATTMLEWVANEAMQIHGGAGYLRGSRVERIYRETKVLTIGGGSLEIMKDLAARQLGL